MIKNMLLLIFLLNSLPAATASVPLVPKPNAEIVAFGLQTISTQSAQEVPITALDVIAGQRRFSSFSSADQSFVRDQFQKYEASPQHLLRNSMSPVTADTTSLAHDPFAQDLKEVEVSFILHPYLELVPNVSPAPGAKNDITAYGQPVNVNNSRFAEFLRSLSLTQATRLLHHVPSAVGGLSVKQQLFVSDLWRDSSRPECVKLCSAPDIQVIVGFYLEAVMTPPHQNGTVICHVQLPQDDRDFFEFNAAEGQQGQVWMRF